MQPGLGPRTGPKLLFEIMFNKVRGLRSNIAAKPLLIKCGL